MLARLVGKVKRELRARHIIQSRKDFAFSYFKGHLQRIEEWAGQKSESSNFYYELTESNRLYLAHLISVVSQQNVDQILGYFSELETDL